MILAICFPRVTWIGESISKVCERRMGAPLLLFQQFVSIKSVPPEYLLRIWRTRMPSGSPQTGQNLQNTSAANLSKLEYVLWNSKVADYYCDNVSVEPLLP